MEIFVWCSPHTPLEVQKNQLLAGGNSEILYLKDLNSELFDSLCNIADNERELSSVAVELIDWFRQNSLKWMVQPAGSQPFQVLLGMNLLLERQLGNSNIELVYSHSEKVSVDKHNPDGSVTKISEFNHVKFMSI